MPDAKKETASSKGIKSVEYETISDPDKHDPYKALLNALNGFNGWTLPPLDHRADTSGDA